VPRVLALGVFALTVPKREEVAYLVAETADGEAIIECRRTGVMELRSAVQPLTRSLAAAIPTVTTVGARERLAELTALHDDGLITAREYQERRAEIIESI
jgi:hypothetical protein